MGEERRSSEDWIVTEYRPGDENEILQLFSNGFGVKRSIEHWNWKFRDNPYKGPIATLARVKDSGRLVGQYTVMPTTLNFMGRAVQSCQSLDTLVETDYRMRGIFERLASVCFEGLRKNGFHAVYGFPNKNSYPGFIHKLGWEKICSLKHYVAKLDIKADLKRVIRFGFFVHIFNFLFRAVLQLGIEFDLWFTKKNVPADVLFQTWDSIPSHYQKFWSEFSAQEVLSIWKDGKYLSWRYDQNPDNRFRYFGLTQNDQIVAFAVVMENEPNHWICELMASRRNTALGKYLTNSMRKFYFNRHARCLEFTGYDSGFFEEALYRFKGRVSFDQVFCGKTFNDQELTKLFSNPECWSITFGDIDSA